MTTDNLVIEDDDTIDQYTSVGEDTFGFNFPVLATDELKVSRNQGLLTYGTDYTITGLGDAEGGTVELVDGSDAGDIITLWLDKPIERLTGFKGGAAALMGEALNDEFADVQRDLQMLRRMIGRALRLPPDDPLGQTGELPPASERLGMIQAYSATTGAPELLAIVPSGTPISSSIVGVALYPTLTLEGATVVNNSYPYGYADRYGTNGTEVPRTTDMAPAFNAAYQAAKLLGCPVRWGATAPYRLNSPVNCSGMRGIVSTDESSKNASAGEPSIIIAHDGHTYSHGFDLSCSTEMTFREVVATNLAGKVPHCVFFAARNEAGSGAGVHRFENCRTPSDATFDWFYYGVGSEENNYRGCFVYNTQSGSGVFSHNSTNPAGYTSAFQTIGAGPWSNAGHHHWGGSYFQFGNSGSHTEVVFDCENVSDFSFEAGLWFCKNGLAKANFRGDAGTQGIVFRGIRAEADGSTRATYGILCNNSAGSHINWTIDNCQVDATQELLYVGDATSISRLNIVVSNSSFSGKVFNAKNATNVTINHGTGSITGRAAGTIANSTFIGSRSQITFSGTDTANTGFDQALGEAWETNDRYTAASTACTGALTAAVVWKLVKKGPLVTLTLPATVGTCTAATSFTYGVVLPSTYRPAADLWFPCIIQNNGATVNQPGIILVSASTGAITVFRDMIATAFTNAAAGGLQNATGLSWRL